MYRGSINKELARYLSEDKIWLMSRRISLVKEYRPHVLEVGSMGPGMSHQETFAAKDKPMHAHGSFMAVVTNATPIRHTPMSNPNQI